MAVRDDFSAGEVLAAADLNDTFASKVDYALPTNAQTGTAYTFVAADAEKLTTASNGSAVTLTIPPASSVAWPDNTVLRVVNYGAGAVTIDGGSGVTVTNTSSTIAQYGAAVAIRTGSDAWTVVPFGGGDVPAATVSSPAATGQYTDSGTTYDYYTFTASGTLTVDTAGFADVLVVGGGGAGGGYIGGGGGAGAYLDKSNVYLPAGTATVTVGAGGAGVVPATNQGTQGGVGSASNIDIVYSAGGGGGGASGGGGGAAGPRVGLAGGSGGGHSGNDITIGSGGSSLAVGFYVGNDGGSNATTASPFPAAGGGGANAVGADGSGSQSGAGGNGQSSSITGSSVTYAGGGGGGSTTQGASAGAGGSGGGGSGATSTVNAVAGSANTGGGGGGGRNVVSALGGGANGGSGVVIVRVAV